MLLWNRRIVHLSAVAALVFAHSAVAQDQPLPPSQSDTVVDMNATIAGSGFQLAGPGGAVLRTSPNPIVNARRIEVAGSAAWVAVWDEVQASRQNQSFYRVSPDGQSLSRVRQTTYTIRVRYANFDPLVDGEPAVAPELAAPASSELYLVQFFAPPLEEMRQAIRALGGDVVRYMADHTHIVRMSAEARDQVAQLSYVRWVGPFHVAYKLDGEILGGLTAGMPESADTYSIEAFGRGPAEQEAVKALIEQAGGQVQFITELGFRMGATLTPAQLLSVARMNEVHYVARWKLEDPEDMDIVRQLSGTDFVEGATGFSGEGVRGESFDSGFQINHQDFTPTPIWRSATGTESHGTATYGVMFGTGFGNAQARGICPDLEQGFVTRYQVTTQFGGSITRHSLYQAAVDPFGTVRIVNSTSSVGPYRTSSYDPISAEVDDYLFLYDLLSCQSMSNVNNTTSVRPQAWAKNMIGVGGITHNNNLNRADDFASGSRGPAEDGRIKPDLAHFYEGVTTTYSTSTTGYGTFGGTSNATPCTCGHAALFFQMWHEGTWLGRGGAANVFDSRAKMATAKAALINTAYRYDWNSGGPNGNMSRTRQGWGMVDVAKMYNQRDKTFIIDEEDLLVPGGVRSYPLTVLPGEAELNVTLVYTDPMGPTSANLHRINDLSLRVTPPSGTAYWGNNGLLAGNWSTPGGVSNTVDTVENVFVQNPLPGTWIVEVFGDVIVQDAHPETGALDADFSLFVTGITPIPPPLIIRLPNGVPPSVLPLIQTDIAVTVEDGLEILVPGSPTLHYRTAAAGAFTSVPLTPTGGIDYLATLPGFDCADQPEFYISALGDGGTTVFSPGTAPASTHATVVGGQLPIYSDNFETNQGWTVQNVVLLAGAWERGVPVGGGLRGDPPTDFDGSGSCFLTENAAGDSDVDGGPTRLTSPLINLAGQTDLTLSYARWFTVNTPDIDRLDVEISNDNGANWTLVESADSSPGWVPVSFDVTSMITPTSQMRLRFSATDNPNNTITEAALDAVMFTAFGCDPSLSCTRGDLNANGDVNGVDVSRFVELLINGGASALEICAGDLEPTPNGVIDPGDIDEFVNCVLNAGC